MSPMDDFLSQHARTVLLGDRRCTATNRSGERCGRASAVGQFVCDHHGAKSPLSIRAGLERLAILAEPALDVLFRATRNAPPCEVCGRSDADRDPNAIRAAIAILDRFGLGPHVTMELRRARSTEMATMSLSELADRAEQIARDARQAADEEAARLLPKAEDGVLLDDDTPIQEPVVRNTTVIPTPEKSIED